jgi:hypothetical protein
MSLLSRDRGAVLSADGLYRYRLWRIVGSEFKRVVVVMLNPSTADAEVDDPTIRRCVAFARREGCGRLDVVNLYGFRATDPKALRGVEDPIGPANDEHILAASDAAHLVVVAWGADAGPVVGRDDAVVHLLRDRGAVHCLGTTAKGAPRHPLYLRADAPLAPWSPQ